MTNSYYSVALSFYNAKAKKDIEHFEESDCRKALSFLMLDFSFILNPLSQGGYRLTYESGNTVCFATAKQALRFLAVAHKNSQVWHAQASATTVWDTARKMAAKAGSSDAERFLDAAAIALSHAYFQQPDIAAKAKAHFAFNPA